MPSAASPIRDISDTALWTAAYRAEETRRPDALFRDPFAERLAGARGPEIIRAIKQPAVRHGVTLRTAAIDRIVSAAIADRKCDVVLNLAAGLDTRAYRLELPQTLRWFDVDRPLLLDYKSEILQGETPRCAHEDVRLDLEDRQARQELFERVDECAGRVFVLTEGLLSYLPPESVALLATDLHGRPSFAEWVTDITGGQISERIKTAGDDIRPTDAKTRFFPSENTAFFKPYGWTEAEYVDLFLQAHELGRDSFIGRTFRGLRPVLPAKLRNSVERALGVVRLQRHVA